MIVKRLFLQNKTQRYLTNDKLRKEKFNAVCFDIRAAIKFLNTIYASTNNLITNKSTVL